MIEIDRVDLEYELGNMDKSKIITLFIKLKDINGKLAERVNLLETQINELTNLDELFKEYK